MAHMCDVESMWCGGCRVSPGGLFVPIDSCRLTRLLCVSLVYGEGECCSRLRAAVCAVWADVRDATHSPCAVTRSIGNEAWQRLPEIAESSPGACRLRAARRRSREREPAWSVAKGTHTPGYREGRPTAPDPRAVRRRRCTLCERKRGKCAGVAGQSISPRPRQDSIPSRRELWNSEVKTAENGTLPRPAQLGA